MIRRSAKRAAQCVEESLPFQKALSIFLRVASLAAKLLLTLYMGRYLALTEIGVYGLVFSAVMISTSLLGMRLDYVAGRDLVGASAPRVCRMIRDVGLFYTANCVVLAFVMLGVAFFAKASPLVLLSVYLIAVFESIASVFSSNLVSMGRPLLSTALFFVRSGLWCLVVVVAGLLFPQLRSVEAILFAWTLGAALGAVLPLWSWRGLPWRETLRVSIDRAWLINALKKSFPVWLGTVGAMTASSVDRFVVSAYLDMEKVGIVTFYSSFAFALLSLVHSGFFSFSYPRLIEFHQNGKREAFTKQAFDTGIEVSVFMLVATVILGVLMPLSAPYFGKPELAAERLTFWLMLGAVWIRSVGDSFYYILYARGQDKPLWMGDMLYLLPVIVGNVILVPLIGLAGVGYSAVVAASLLLLWLGFFTYRKL